MPTAWLDDVTRSALELIAEALVELAGFGVAAISVARDDGTLHVAVIAGSDKARAELAGHTTPIDALRAELAQGDQWGYFTFVPHERLQGTGLPGWVPDLEPVAGEDAWHPEDLLVALLHDADGDLRATLAIDVPDDRRRPGPERREVLERFAGQAERAVVTALERARLADQLRLADAAREVIRRAASDLDMSRLVERIGDPLLAATGAEGLWLRIFGEDGGPSEVASVASAAGTPLPREPRTGEVAERSARKLWRRQLVGALYPDALEDLEDDEDTRALQRYADRVGVGSLLLVPLGVGPECLGALTLARAAGAPRWTEVEMTATFELGRELGQLLLHGRAYRRAQRLARELRTLDDYKSRLVTSGAEELRRPLRAIAGDLRRLRGTDRGADVDRQLDVMERGTQRMVRLVDELALLASASDPGHELDAEPVDLLPIVRQAVELSAAAARGRDLSVRVAAPGPAVALGDAAELDVVVANLLSNAVKYSTPGGSVTVTLRVVGDPEGRRQVELAVADEGIGISVEDQPRLWTEFFRSTNPVALELPGTGLGLAIVDRIVRRHGGSVSVESMLGVGSTFRVRLPEGGVR